MKRGSPYGPIAAAADPNWGARTWDRARLVASGIEMASLFDYCPPFPSEVYRLQRLVSERTTLSEVDTKSFELFLLVAGSNPQNESSIRKHLQCGACLRGQERIPVRQDENIGYELELARQGCQSTKRHERINAVMPCRIVVQPMC